MVESLKLSGIKLQFGNNGKFVCDQNAMMAVQM